MDLHEYYFSFFCRTSGDITPLVARYSLFDIIHARLGVVRVFLIRNCCSRYGLSWHESFWLFIFIC